MAAVICAMQCLCFNCAQNHKKKTWKHSTCTLTSTCQKQTERFNPCNKNDNYNLEINTLFIKLTTKKPPTRLRFESLSIKLVICENIPNGKMDGKCNCTAKLQSSYVSSSVVFFKKVKSGRQNMFIAGVPVWGLTRSFHLSTTWFFF